MITLAIIAVVLAFLAFAAVHDRRARRRGSKLRSSAEMARAERDVRRNVRALKEFRMVNPTGTDWDKPDERRFGH